MPILICLSQFQYIAQSIKNITEDVSNYQLAYASHEDICACFKGETLLAVQAPNGTQLEVPIPDLMTGMQAKKRYQIHLKSNDGQIYVLLINKDAENEEPFVAEVPLPKDVQDAMDQDRKVGRKAKASTDLGPQTKKIKAEDAAAEAEVEQILSNKVLDTSIPELDDIVSSGSKFFLNPFVYIPFQPFCFAVFGPLMRLSPPPSERDYYFNLDDNEGVCDLFDAL